MVWAVGLAPLLISRMSGTPLPESKKSVPTMFRSIGSSYPGFTWQLRPGSLKPDFALAVIVFLIPQSHGPTYGSHLFTTVDVHGCPRKTLQRCAYLGRTQWVLSHSTLMTLLEDYITYSFMFGVIFLSITAVRRLFLHRLRGFPGPKLAAITSLYKTYYEVLKGGELLQHLTELHEIYGPVIRIAPNELHFNQYSAYADIYFVGSRFTKEPRFYQSFGADGSTFGAINLQDSKSRRNMLNTLFSRRAIMTIEAIVQEKVGKLVSRLATCHEQSPANMFLAFRCTSMDIIATYCFGRCDNSLDAEDFHDPLLMTMQSTIAFFWLIKFLPFLVPLAAFLPQRVVARFNSQFLAFFRLRNMVADQTTKISHDQSFLDSTETRTIYQHVLAARVDKSNPLVSSRHDLLEEALSLLQAGSDTVGNTCTIGTFYILNDRDVYSRLSDELQEVWPDKSTQAKYTVLEKLPYLTAVVKESLRMSHGIVTPLPRVVGPTNAVIAGHNVPVGTVVGVSATCLHNNKIIFPEPFTFSPKRWTQPNSRELEKYLVPFSKGPRMCLGVNLAWCELYLIFGYIFRRLDMEIYNTTVEDFRRFKDFFIPIHQGKQLHVLAKEKTT